MISIKVNDAKMLALVLLALFSGFLQAGSEAIPELAAPGLFLGQSMDQFLREHPDAVISGQRKGAEQYWLRREDGSLVLVAFRSGEVAMLSLAIKSLSGDEQLSKTRFWVSELTKRYGDPQWISAGKVVKDGVVRAASLIYDLGGGTSVVLQSTEIELSLTQADFGKIEFDRIVVPFSTLEKKFPKVDQVKESPVFKDYLKELIESSDNEKLQFRNDTQSSPLKMNLPLGSGDTSRPIQVPPSPAAPALPSTRLWLLLPVLALASAGLLFFWFRKGTLGKRQ